MRDNQMPNWLDDLISSESKALSKKAQAEDKIDEISKRIDEAETPEELAAIEKELNEIEQSNKDDVDTKAATDESSDDSGSDDADSSENSDSDEDQDEQDFENDVDLSDIMKEVKGLKSDVDDKKEKLEEKIVNQLEQLNDQIGLNKIVDLNSTVDSGM